MYRLHICTFTYIQYVLLKRSHGVFRDPGNVLVLKMVVEHSVILLTSDANVLICT